MRLTERQKDHSSNSALGAASDDETEGGRGPSAAGSQPSTVTTVRRTDQLRSIALARGEGLTIPTSLSHTLLNRPQSATPPSPTRYSIPRMLLSPELA